MYLVWAEKCKFLEEAIIKNYFNTKCFYWIDIGIMRFTNKIDYYRNFPSTNKCLSDPRVLFNQIRKFRSREIYYFKKLNNKFYKKFMKLYNVGGGMFGGKSESLKKFIDLYYNTVRLFANNNMFIGKDQNLFAYIALFNPNLVNMVYSGENWFYFLNYLN